MIVNIYSWEYQQRVIESYDSMLASMRTVRRQATDVFERDLERALRAAEAATARRAS